MVKPAKPLGRRAYGSIGHLPNSRVGPADHHVHEGQALICTQNAGGRKVYVQEKLDGSCVSVARIGDDLVPLIRAGYTARDSHRAFHHDFHDWAMDHGDQFLDLLGPGERVVGEWLALAHGTRYDCPVPFVAFDIMREADRLPVWVLEGRFHGTGLEHVSVIGEGPMTPEAALRRLGPVGGHGAHPDDGPEGVVYRVESKGKVDFLAKWVRPDKADGKYLADVSGGDDVWNWRPERVDA